MNWACTPEPCRRSSLALASLARGEVTVANTACALGSSKTTPNSTITTAAVRLMRSLSMPTRWPKAVTETPMSVKESVSPMVRNKGPSRLC